MEHPAFWRDLEARFREPGDQAFDLRAHHDDLDFPQLITEIRAQLGALRAERQADPIALEMMERRLTNAEAEAAVPRDPRGSWYIDGGPNNEQERRMLRVNFEALAERGAVGAGRAPSLTPEQAVQEWLHMVNGSGSPYLKFFGIDRLFDASALMCQQLGTEALRRSRIVSSSTRHMVGGPRLAVWLAEAMRLREHVSANRLAEHANLSGKTIRKMLEGKQVREGGLPRLAKGLTALGPSVPDSTIPRD